MNEFELISRLTRSLPTNKSVVAGPGDDCADAPADADERSAGTEMADGMAAMFGRLREAAAAHDTSELNDIALPS